MVRFSSQEGGKPKHDRRAAVWCCAVLGLAWWLSSVALDRLGPACFPLGDALQRSEVRYPCRGRRVGQPGRTSASTATFRRDATSPSLFPAPESSHTSLL
jgi:hypothetical protein